MTVFNQTSLFQTLHFYVKAGAVQVRCKHLPLITLVSLSFIVKSVESVSNNLPFKKTLPFWSVFTLHIILSPEGPSFSPVTSIQYSVVEVVEALEVKRVEV